MFAGNAKGAAPKRTAPAATGGTGGAALDGADYAVAGDAADDHIWLSLGDLLPDADGNVVLLADAGLTGVGILTREKVQEFGRVKGRRTAAGMNVSGFHFMSFESGLTLYYPASISLRVSRPAA